MPRVTKNGRIPWKLPREKRVGLIDADGILFAAAHKGVTICEGEQLQVLDDEEILRDCLKRLNEQAEWLGDCKTVFVCLSARETFRKRILPSYKGNRKGGDRPITLDALRGAMIGDDHEGFKTVLIQDLEADDVCGIVATRFQALGYETVIVSPDKDMLTIPGMNLAPKPLGKAPVFSEVPKERADYYHLYQTLMGDTTDNYRGCPGVGPTKAERILEPHVGDVAAMWEAVVDAFEAKGLTADDALVQARCARILRCEDWDEETKEVILWEAPE